MEIRKTGVSLIPLNDSKTSKLFIMTTIQDLKAALMQADWDYSESQNLQETHIEANYHNGIVYGTLVCNNGLGSVFSCGVYTTILGIKYKHLFPKNKFITIEI